MGKYLDATGLGTLWSTAKNKFVIKAGEINGDQGQCVGELRIVNDSEINDFPYLSIHRNNIEFTSQNKTVGTGNASTSGSGFISFTKDTGNSGGMFKFTGYEKTWVSGSPPTGHTESYPIILYEGVYSASIYSERNDSDNDNYLSIGRIDYPVTVYHHEIRAERYQAKTTTPDEDEAPIKFFHNGPDHFPNQSGLYDQCPLFSIYNEDENVDNFTYLDHNLNRAIISTSGFANKSGILQKQYDIFITSPKIENTQLYVGQPRLFVHIRRTIDSWAGRVPFSENLRLYTMFYKKGRWTIPGLAQKEAVGETNYHPNSTLRMCDLVHVINSSQFEIYPSQGISAPRFMSVVFRDVKTLKMISSSSPLPNPQNPILLANGLICSQGFHKKRCVRVGFALFSPSANSIVYGGSSDTNGEATHHHNWERVSNIVEVRISNPKYMGTLSQWNTMLNNSPGRRNVGIPAIYAGNTYYFCAGMQIRN